MCASDDDEEVWFPEVLCGGRVSQEEAHWKTQWWSRWSSDCQPETSSCGVNCQSGNNSISNTETGLQCEVAMQPDFVITLWNDVILR